MASLLELVDSLIGDVLAGNIYNNVDTYQQLFNAGQSPLLATSNPTQAALQSNLYKDSDVPFNGKFGILSQRPVPSFLRYADITATGHWLRNIAKELGILNIISALPGVDIVPGPNGSTADTIDRVAKGASFVAQQFLLASLNPGDPQLGPGNNVWNPLSFANAVPFVAGMSTATNIVTGPNDYSLTHNQPQERLLLMRQGLYVEINPVQQLAQFRKPNAGFLGNLSKPGKIDSLETFNPSNLNASTIEGQVDGGGLGELAIKAGLHTNPYNADRPYSKENAIMPLEKLEKEFGNAEEIKLKDLFTKSEYPGGATWKTNSRLGKLDGIKSNASSLPSMMDVLHPLDDIESALKLDEPIDDASNYLPFMFQDLRDPIDQFLYFRAFLKDGFNETMTPDWQLDRFYGRVDQIPVYMGTTRNINLAFDIVAWGKDDLKPMYLKLQKLQSMVYPSYNSTGFLQNGPIIRMRVGDLISSNTNKGKGLGGYITALNFDYDDGIWNLETDMKVPRKVTVTLSFTVLHEGNPGLYPIKNNLVFADGTEDASFVDDSKKKTIFAVAHFKGNGSGDTTITVSEGNLRKVFGTIKGEK